MNNNISTAPTATATILIVDDEIQSRKLLVTLLRSEGYLTQIASNGKDALALIAQHAPDVILLDVMMPDMDGLEVTRILKGNTATANIPIIMVTALTDHSDLLAGLEAGVEEFLTKPVDRAELWLRVRNMLRLKELSDFLQNHACVLEEQVQVRTKQLQEANLELQTFSYSVSHDLRAPLNTIDGFTGLLHKEISATTLSKKSQHYIARIRAGVQQMGGLIDAMLSLAHLSRVVLRSENVDLSGLAETILEGYREREPGRALQVEIQPNLLVQGDPNLLLNVLENLLGNAWKFSSHEPQSLITFRRESGPDGDSVYAVQDNGAGFNMAYSDKLFVAFQRLHNQSEFTGTGIGLITTRRIIERHGGRIWAKSVQGEGATFYFTIGKLQV